MRNFIKVLISLILFILFILSFIGFLIVQFTFLTKSPYNYIFLSVSGIFFFASAILFFTFIIYRLKENMVFKEVFRFILPLKERYNGEIFLNSTVFPYYYKNLRKKNGLFVWFDKNFDNSLVMNISITYHHNFNLKLTKDIAYSMLGEKLFEGYGARYEEDSIERKLRQRVKNQKNINHFLSSENRFSVVERLLNAGFDIEFDHFNVNIKMNPVNLKDNYYLFRGVEALIELVGLDKSIMENIPQVNNKKNKKIFIEEKSHDPNEIYEEAGEEILYYGPVINLIGMINDKRLFPNKKQINFNVPPSQNNTYIMSSLKNEIYSNFTGKYIPIGTILKALLRYKSKKYNSKKREIHITTTKSRITITDNHCKLSLKELLVLILSPFYLSYSDNKSKIKLHSPFISLFRYAFTDPDNFRFAFSSSIDDECYEIVFYSKGSKLRDIYAIIKKFNKKIEGSIIKIKWEMLYPLNVRKYIRHKFINAINKDVLVMLDGYDILSKKPSHFEKKDDDKLTNLPQKIKSSKFFVDLDCEKERRRFRLYSNGILIKQLNNTPWDIIIDLPDTIEFVKDLSNFKRTKNYNEYIISFFDYLADKLINSNIELNEILNGFAYLSEELIEDYYLLKHILLKIKTRLIPEKEYCCQDDKYEMIKAFFNKDISKKLLLIENKDALLLWSVLFGSGDDLFIKNLNIIEKDIIKSELKNNGIFNTLPEESKKLILHYLIKSPFKGKIYIVNNKENSGVAPFCSLNGDLYFNIDAKILKENPLDPMFKYIVITSLLKGCGLTEKEIEREVMV